MLWKEIGHNIQFAHVEVRFGGARASDEDHTNSFVAVFFFAPFNSLVPIGKKRKEHTLLASYFLFVFILYSSVDFSYIETTSAGLIHLKIFFH